jgi:hypothetical protein
MHYIFEIENKINNKLYRFSSSHHINLNNIKRACRSNIELFNDINKYEIDNFQITLLFKTDMIDCFKKKKKELINISFRNSENTYNVKTNYRKNHVIVKDSSGNTFSINKNDPRYINGELIPNTQGKVVAKDSLGNTFSINKNDPRYINGELVSKNKGLVVVRDQNNNIFSTSTSDPLYLNGTYSHVNSNTIKIGNKFVHYSNVNKEELTHYNKKFPNFEKQILLKNKKLYIKDYCKHGDLYINFKDFNLIYNAKDSDCVYCEKCRNDIVKYFNKEKYVKEKYDLLLNNIHKSNLTKKYLLKVYPHLYAFIFNFIIDKNLDFHKKIILFKLNERIVPKCNYNNCENDIIFAAGHRYALKYCRTHIKSGRSDLEKEIFSYISSYENYVIPNYRKYKKEIDIFIPNKNIGFEINGLYWHNEENKDASYHYDKWFFFKNKNINLITIWEDDWRNKQDIVKSMIINSLYLTPIEKKINARLCGIKEVKYPESKEFLEKNHIQGYVPSNINLGLFFNNNLVSLMTFGKNRNILNHKNVKDEYEILRFSSLNFHLVRGGASKLLKYFIEQYSPSKIISFSNNDIGVGNLYKTLNFIDEGHTGLNYWWYKDGIKYHRSNFMKHKLVAEGEDPNKTEYEIMKSRGFSKIYGSGNTKWVKYF